MARFEGNINTTRMAGVGGKTEQRADIDIDPSLGAPIVLFIVGLVFSVVAPVTFGNLLATMAGLPDPYPEIENPFTGGWEK